LATFGKKFPNKLGFNWGFKEFGQFPFKGRDYPNFQGIYPLSNWLALGLFGFKKGDGKVICGIYLWAE